MIESIAVLATAGSLLMSGVMWANKNRRRASWSELAKQLGLTVSRYSDATTIEGRIGGYNIVINGNANAWFQAPVTVHFLLPFPPLSMTMFSESAGTRLMKLVKREDLDTGDVTFDNSVHVHGDEIHCLALLNGDARQSVSGLLNRHGVTMESGQFVLELEEMDPQRIDRAISAMCEAADDMNPGPCELPDLLAENTINDPIPTVALHNFDILIRHFPDSDITRNVARAAGNKPYAPLRYLALHFLKDEGLDGLKKMALNSNTEGEWRVKALDHYCSVQPHDIELLVKAVEDSSYPELQGRAAEFLGKIGDNKVTKHIWLSAVDLMKYDRNDRIVATMVTAISRLGGPWAESSIHEIVGYKADQPTPSGYFLDPVLALAVVRALYRVGSTTSVIYLQRLADGIGAKPQSEVVSIAQSAINRIQRKIDPGSTGGLSVIDDMDTEGHVSVVPDDGALSLQPLDEDFDS